MTGDTGAAFEAFPNRDSELTRRRRLGRNCRQWVMCCLPECVSAKAAIAQLAADLLQCQLSAALGQHQKSPVKQKDLPKAVLSVTDGGPAQAKLGVLFLRRYVIQPNPRKPRIIIPHVEGSGTADIDTPSPNLHRIIKSVDSAGVVDW